MKKIRIAQVGTWGLTHADHIMQCMRSLPQYFDVVGVCEPDAERRALAQKRDAYNGLNWLTEEEILADASINAVAVETSELTQAETALRYAKKGFHIHMDKPGCESLSLYQELTETAAKNDVVFQTGYMYRYNPAIVKAEELIQSGKIGDIICIEAQMSQNYSKEMVRAFHAYQGGMMYYLGCHLIDLIYRFQGEPEKITVLNQNTSVFENTAQDFGFVLLHYKNGISFVKTVCDETYGNMRRQLVISGTRGTIEIKPIENPITHPAITNANSVTLSLHYNPGLQPGVLREESYFCGPYGRYDDMMLDFAKMIYKEKATSYSPEYEVAVHKLLLRACEIET